MCLDDYLLRIWKGPDEAFRKEGFVCLFENELFTAESCFWKSFNKYKMDTTGAAMQILQQFESAFSDFLNPNTPQDQRNAIG